MKYFLITFFLLGINYSVFPQQLEIDVSNSTDSKAYLYSLSGEKASLIDSIFSNTRGQFTFQANGKILHDGIYRLAFGNKWIDFISDGKDLELRTDATNISDSLRIINSESNKLYYSFLKLNNGFKTKSELLQLILAKYPKEDEYYTVSKKRLIELQNEYRQFVKITAQGNPNSFVAKYIRSAQLSVIDISIPFDQQLTFLKTHALDHVDFHNPQLIYSDVFTSKSIEYLSYFRNPQYSFPVLEKEFMGAVDSILNKAKVNQVVYQHVTEYLIEGFKKFGFDKILDYIVDNYVIKDELCLDVKTEGLIKKRIDQARIFKIGYKLPDIIMPDISGKEISLANIDATKTLIVFYASWCPHCTELLPKLNDLRKKQTGNKFEVLAISLDAKKEDWINFVKAKCPDLINVADLKGWDGKISNDFNIYATPTMFVIDKERKIIAKPTTYEELQKVIQVR